jgi:AraC-like DNA-binding protein
MKWEMALPSLKHWRTWVAPLPHGSEPLGTISLAGSIAFSRGIDKANKRIFGQWALVYLVGGQGAYADTHGNESKVSAGDWILVFPDIAHHYGPGPGEVWHEIYVCFQGPVFDAWRDAGYFDPRNPTGNWLPPAQGVRRFDAFFKSLARRGCTSLEAVCHWQQFLSRLFQKPWLGSRNEPWLQRALELLESSATGAQGHLESVAAECQMGYESFRKKFEAAVGMPPGRYAMERRIERARRLIRMHRLSNKELAEILGFHDEFHFSKTFTKLTGISPREFRRKIEALP